MNLINPKDLGMIIPELALVVTLLTALVLDLALGKRGGRIVALTAIAGLVVAMFADMMLLSKPGTALFHGMIIKDGFGIYLQLIAAIAACMTILISMWTSEIKDQPTAGAREYYFLLIAATIGMFFLVSSTNLLMLYLSMELLSLPSYLLVGWLKRSRKSTEAGIKYIVYGAAASCAMIYGISLLYGLSGSLAFDGIKVFAGKLMVDPSLPKATFILALLLTLSGFFFKVAAFPLFQWAPDVYEGAPTPITAFLAVGSKAAGMGALIRFIFMSIAAPDDSVVVNTYHALSGVNWPLIIAVVSVLTMTFGNFMALAQKNAKRLLAYSSIAHAGYILMGIPVLSTLGIQAMLFYLLVYLIMNLGAFLSVIVLENRGISPEIENYRGMGARAPWLAIPFAIFLFSLVGIPPFAGFIGKVYLFAALIKAQWYRLAIIGVLNSVVGLYYYANIVRVMFLQKPIDETPVESVEYLRTILWLLVIPTLLLGIYWKPIIAIAQIAAYSIGVEVPTVTILP